MNLFCRRCNTHHDFTPVEMERIIYTLQIIDEQRHVTALKVFEAIANRADESEQTYPSDPYRPDCLVDLLAASTDAFMGRVDSLTNKEPTP